MKAYVYERYGGPDVLELRDIPVPELRPDSVLVRVHAVSLNRSDWETLTGRPAYVRIGALRTPSDPVLGSDVAGRVEAVGSDVTEFEPGDEVFGDTLFSGHGGFAEYVRVPEAGPLVTKPAGISFAEASTIPQAGILGLQGMRQGGAVASGDRVLVNGAGGGGGTYAVQIAKSMGTEVTGVDHTTKLDTMRSIGADRVIDYTSDDYTSEGAGYDRILDFVGNRSIFAQRRALRPGGRYLVAGGPVPRILQAAVVGGLMSWIGSRHLGVLLAKPNKRDLTHLGELVETGTITPVVDGTYGLADVPAALARLGAGGANGKIVITM